jgi:hypothetical protein
MAIVRNRASLLTPIDPRYTSPNRSGAGTPVGTIVPLYTGELYSDTTNRVVFQASGLTNNDWTPIVIATRA